MQHVPRIINEKPVSAMGELQAYLVGKLHVIVSFLLTPIERPYRIFTYQGVEHVTAIVNVIVHCTCCCCTWDSAYKS